MANRLAGETSPYLLQHKDNPVAWQPWDERALAEARERDVPILVSIGYAACHWCHVMERESFEDAAVAALMNERFVCIKVDREERPDVDAIYMEAVQAMTGHGGWPLNAFLTPDQEPFFAGTYFPPAARQGMPSWRHVLEAVATAWDQRRDEIRVQGARVAQAIGASARIEPREEPLGAELLESAVAGLAQAFDRIHGGFGSAPKFPPASAAEFLLRRGEPEMALATLRAMARGGINDQVGGGFARYAIDNTWTVPHFEKMLYDNALLARAYLHGWQASGDELLRRTCCETLDFALRELGPAEAGFAASLDADSEGVEGRFYVWTVDELHAALGADADDAIAYFGATARGNFEGANVLRADGPEPPVRERIRATLLEARAARVRPGLDDKRLTSWNALMINALADAGAALGRPDYLSAARACADFVLRELRADDGRLLRTYNRGQARLAGYLEDHAFMLEALLTLYEATFEPRWFMAARELGDVVVARFADPERGGFFATADDHERLIARRKDLEDSPIPSGNAAAAFGLLRLALLTGEASYEEHAQGVLALLGPIAARHPTGFGHLLSALDFHLAPVREVAIVGPGAEQLLATVRTGFRPHLVLAGGEPDGVPLLAGREPVGGRAAAYVCERFACQAPVTEPAELERLLA